MLAPEARLPLALVVGAAAGVLATAGGAAALPLWLLAGAVLRLFWEERRQVPAVALGVVSPVDARVSSVREAWDPWLGRQVWRLGLRLRLPGLLPLRSPTEGKLRDYERGTRRHQHDPSWRVPLGTRVSHSFWVRTDEGDDVVVVVSAPWPFHRIAIYPELGKRVGQGQRCGFVYFGRRVDVLVGRGSRVEVEPGQAVRAGADVLATLLRR